MRPSTETPCWRCISALSAREGRPGSRTPPSRPCGSGAGGQPPPPPWPGEEGDLPRASGAGSARPGGGCSARAARIYWSWAMKNVPVRATATTRRIWFSPSPGGQRYSPARWDTGVGEGSEKNMPLPPARPPDRRMEGCGGPGSREWADQDTAFATLQEAGASRQALLWAPGPPAWPGWRGPGKKPEGRRPWAGGQKPGKPTLWRRRRQAPYSPARRPFRRLIHQAIKICEKL